MRRKHRERSVRRKGLARVLRLAVVLPVMALLAGGAIAGRVGPHQPGLRIAPRPVAMGFDPLAGHLLVVSGTDLQHRGSAAMLDSRTGALLATTPLGVGARALDIDPARSRAVVANGGRADGEGDPIATGSVSVLDTRSGAVARTIGLLWPPRAVTIGRASGHVFVSGGYASKAGWVGELDPVSGRTLRTVRVGFNPNLMVADPRTARLFVANAGISRFNSSVAVLDVRSGRLLATTPLAQQPDGIAVDVPRGRIYVTGISFARQHVDGVAVLDARSGRLLGTVFVGPGNFSVAGGVAVDQRRGHVFVPTNSGSVAMLDGRTGHLLRISAMPTNMSEPGMAVDERAGRLYVANGGATYVLDTGSGLLLRTIQAPAMVVGVDRGGGAVFLAGADPARERDPAHSFWLAIRSWFGHSHSCEGCGLPYGAIDPGLITMESSQ